ncbi:armadillo-type protein [Zopfochytrium polystomum]|nr:armadillo-type protein [Zopfochytrium polystomum]
MDPQHVYTFFQASLSPDQAIRKQAEAGLNELSAQDGILSVLLKIMASSSTEDHVRLSAAVFFKNRVQKGWEAGNELDPSGALSTKRVFVGPQDKSFVREHIVQAIVELPTNIGGVLRAGLETILKNDFQHWTTFLPDVFAKLQSNNYATMYGALVCIYSLLKGFRNEEDTQLSAVVNTVIETFFPTIQSLGPKLVSVDSPEAGSILRMIVKIYSSVVTLELPASLQSADSLVAWCTLFVQIVQKNLAFDEFMKLDPETRERQQWWKVKKWTFRCLYRLQSRCLKKSQVAEKYAQFSENFLTHFAPNILTAVLGEMDKCINGVWASRHVRQQMSIFTANCVKFLSTWNIMRPHAQALTEQFIFPQLCFSDQDEERWTTDPLEYIQREIGEFSEEDKVNPGAAAQHFLSKLSSQRFAQTINGTLQFIYGILVAYKSDPHNPTKARQKYGVLKMMATIAELLLGKNSPVANQLEQAFVDHVFPDFQSQFPFLRAQAWEMLICFEDLVFSEASQGIIFQNILRAVQDAELPVKIWAAQSIQFVVDYEAISEALKPHVADLMKLLLQLTHEIELDNLTVAMEDLAMKYPDELAPFALELSQQMAESFMGIMAEVGDINDEDIDKKWNSIQTAGGILKTIAILVETVDKIPAALAQMEPIVLPIVAFVLQGEVIELYGEALQLPATLMYVCKSVSMNVWQLWDPLYNAAKNAEYFAVEEMFSSFDTFIQYGKDVLIQDPTKLQQAFDVIRMILIQSDRVEDDDVPYGNSLAETLIIYLGQHALPFVPELIKLCMERLQGDPEEVSVIGRTMLLETIIHCLASFPNEALDILEAQNATTTFFSLWLQDADQFPRVHDIKLSILALSAILTSPTKPFLANHLGDLVNALIQYFEKLPAAMAYRQSLIDEEGEDEEDDDEADGVNGSSSSDDDDGDVSDDDSIGFAAYAGQFISDELQEDPEFESCFEGVDPYIRLSDLIFQLPQDHLLRTSLNPQQQGVFQSILSTAEANRNKLVTAA